MTRILVVNQIKLMAQMIAAVLGDDVPDVHVTGLATNIEEALPQLSESDVVILDGDLPNEDSFRLLQALKMMDHHAKVMLFGPVSSELNAHPEVCRRVITAIDEDTPLEDLIASLRAHVPTLTRAVTRGTSGTIPQRLKGPSYSHI
jgi:chemotaxis response regulator CheB